MTKEKTYGFLNDKNYRKADLFFTVFLVLIWGSLVLFGAITLLQPAWWSDLSTPGRKSEARTLVNAGTELMYQSNVSGSSRLVEKAVADFKQAITIDSLLVDAWANLGVAYLSLNKLEEARGIFEKCLALDTINQYYFHSYLGDYYYRKKDWGPALQAYLEAAASHPQPEYALRKAGLLYLKSDSLDLAARCLEMSIAGESSFDSAYASAWEVARLAALTEGDTLTARRISDQKRQTDARRDLQRLDQVVFEKSNRTNKGLAYGYLYLGDVLYAKNDTAGARENYRICLSLNPSFQKLVSEKINGNWKAPE